MKRKLPFTGMFARGGAISVFTLSVAKWVKMGVVVQGRMTLSLIARSAFSKASAAVFM
jgi:hypothetical protein